MPQDNEFTFIAKFFIIKNLKYEGPDQNQRLYSAWWKDGQA